MSKVPCCPECHRGNLYITSGTTKCNCGWKGTINELQQADVLAVQINTILLECWEYNVGGIACVDYNVCKFCNKTNTHSSHCVVPHRETIFDRLNK